MMPEPRKRLSERMRASQSQAQHDKRRLIGMAVLLVLVIVMFVMLRERASVGGPEELPKPGEQLGSRLAEPPVDRAALQEVRDSTPEERVILEPKAFQSIVRGAQLLLPSHFRSMADSELPFDEIEARASELRGKPFRHRGELLGARKTVRTAGGPEEFWCWIRTDEGHDLIFVSLTVPDDLFGAENFVRADGLFFKIYTWSYENERITAPLLVGKELVASCRPAEPVTSIDYGLLAKIRDPELTEDLPIDWDGKWHLLGYAQTVAADPARLEQEFAGAPELDKAAMHDFLNDEEFPASQRGKPWVIHCKVWDSWVSLAGENPLRVEYLTQGYAGNTNWGMPLIHVILPGKVDLPNKDDANTYRILRGWFLQNYAYETGQGSRRRAPVFVVAGVETGENAPIPPWVLQMMGAFLVLAVGMGAVIFVMVRRDRRGAERAASALERIRQNVRAKRKE